MDDSDSIGRPRARRTRENTSPQTFAHYWFAAVVCVLLVIFAVLSYSAVLGKSATFDEPLHVVGGEVHRYLNDYRINPEDPALFGWWSSLPHTASSMTLNSKDAFYEGAVNDVNQQWWFVVSSLYNRGAVVADDYLNRSRFMFVLLGVVLGALIAVWSYQLGGGVAAIASTALFCFDPNMLAHAALVKNDVPLSMLMCAMGFTIWKLGQGRGGNWIFLLLAWLACGLALNVKFSAVLFFPMLGILMLIRAVMPTSWSLWHFEMNTAGRRTLFAIGGVVMAFVVAWAVTWTVYGFRYDATATGDHLNVLPIEKRSISNHIEVEIEHGDRPQISQAELNRDIDAAMAHDEFALPVRIDLWMQANHILPEGWLFGFMYTYASTLARSAFLLGTIRLSGCWYYFPAAILFKTPTATLLSILIAPLLALLVILRLRAEQPDFRESEHWWVPGFWKLVVLVLPPGIYFCTALFTNLNLGLRHILPIYPYLFITLGWIFSGVWQQRRVAATIIASIVLLGLVSETVVAYPNYLAFFNAPSGGARGGLKLLGDSNLDWGQDLPALVRWQHEHPTDRLYLCYFGMADPAQYGLDYVNLPGGFPLSPFADLSAQPGVVAISATDVQGIYLGEQLTHAYQTTLQHEQPFEILNGTIYLYHWPPRHE